jgi:hypothetical protein
MLNMDQAGKDGRTRGGLVTALVAIAVFLAAAPASAEPPSVEQVLSELGFSADDQKKVLAGDFVTTDVKASTDREIAVGMAFFVKQAPKEFVGELLDGLLMEVDPNAHAHGDLKDEASLADLAALTVGDQAKDYLQAKAGGDLNLATAEIAAFAKLKAAGAATDAVDAQVRTNLLARVKAYKASGLDGIAAYDRGGGDQRSAGEELRSASKASVGLKKIAPKAYEIVNDYPKADTTGLQERFRWVNFTAHGSPVVLLVHGFSVTDGDTYIACQRQFYVSGGFNSEQALAGFYPLQGGTLMVYVNRTSTDQVGGFGGSAKRSIGRKVMTSQLEDLFGRLKKAAEK